MHQTYVQKIEKSVRQITSDMQGMVWGEPERGSAQNGIWKCDGDDSSHDSISLVSIASVLIRHWILLVWLP